MASKCDLDINDLFADYIVDAKVDLTSEKRILSLEAIQINKNTRITYFLKAFDFDNDLQICPLVNRLRRWISLSLNNC